MSSPHGEVLRLIDELKRHVIASGGKITPKLDEATIELETLTRAFMLPTIPDNAWGVELTRIEARLMTALGLREGKTMTFSALLDAMYFDKIDQPADKILDVFVCKIRKKLKAANSPYWIETAWGMGYKLVKGGVKKLHQGCRMAA